MLIAEAAVCALTAAVFGAIIKRSNKELSLLFAAAACVVILIPGLEELSPVIESVSALGSSEALGECLPVVIKSLGIVICGEICAGICRDAGESALAGCVALTMKIAVLAVSLPLIEEIFNMLGEIAEM